MAVPDLNRPPSRDRLVIKGLWTLAAALLVTGFALRPLARFFGGPDLRFTSAIVIAFGLAAALAGWCCEKIAARRSL